MTSPTQAQKEKKEWQIGPDLADALVNKQEVKDHLLKVYGPGWVEGYDVVAEKQMLQVRKRQVDVWDYVNDNPGEPLSKSIVFARYNTWDNADHYFPDFGHCNNVLNSTEVGYRAPGTGPYWEWQGGQINTHGDSAFPG